MFLKVCFCLLLQKTTTWKALTQGRILYFCHILKAMKPGKGVALRKEKAFLHTFAAGQKYVVGRDETRRLCFDLKSKEQQINDLLL